MSYDDIKLPPLARPQVPLVEADVSLIDIKVLARWCERTATEYARAAVLADRASRALLAERDELAKDAAKYRWGINNARWIRSEHEAYVAFPVAPDADLSCVAMRDAAIDAARQSEGGAE